MPFTVKPFRNLYNEISESGINPEQKLKFLERLSFAHKRFLRGRFDAHEICHGLVGIARDLDVYKYNATHCRHKHILRLMMPKTVVWLDRHGEDWRPLLKKCLDTLSTVLLVDMDQYTSEEIICGLEAIKNSPLLEVFTSLDDVFVKLDWPNLQDLDVLAGAFTRIADRMHAKVEIELSMLCK